MLNEFVRRIHLHFSLPVLRLLLPRQTDVVARNSVLTPKYFSALWSDVDVAILTQETDEEKLRSIHRIVKRIRAFYPWLGEAEIYAPSSWERLMTLKRELAPKYEQARMLRKYFWFRDHRKMTGPRRLKHERFLTVLRKKLPARNTLEEVIHATFLELIEHPAEQAGEVSFYHDYFQCVISTSASDDNPLPFLPGEAVALARSFPLNSENRKQLGFGAELTPRGRLWVEAEILEVMGAFAGQAKPEWYHPWLASLRSYL